MATSLGQDQRKDCGIMSEPTQTTEPEFTQVCWRDTGVWGDQTCDMLKKQLHCHNCPIFIQAGRELFHRPSPEGYIKE